MVEAPLLTLRVIPNPRPLKWSNPVTRMRVFQDRIELEKPARAIRLDEMDTLCFSDGLMLIAIGDEKLRLGVASRISRAAPDPDETRAATNVLYALKVGDASLATRSTQELASIEKMRRRQSFLVLALIISGAILASLVSRYDEILQWFVMVGVVMLAVALLRRGGDTWTIFHSGCVAMLKGNSAEGLAQFQVLVPANPPWVELHANMALACMRLERFPEADGHFSRALELNPEHPHRDLFEEGVRRSALLKGR